MKLSDVTTKLTCVKSKAFRVLAAATLAGAALAAVPAAQAQHFGVSVQFGGPRYVAPGPVYGYGSGYYERERFDANRQHEAWERQQAFIRQQQWEREHRFNDRGRFDRDHDRFDHR
jgi:hypothetical protein